MSRPQKLGGAARLRLKRKLELEAAGKDLKQQKLFFGSPKKNFHEVEDSEPSTSATGVLTITEPKKPDNTSHKIVNSVTGCAFIDPCIILSSTDTTICDPIQSVHNIDNLIAVNVDSKHIENTSQNLQTVKTSITKNEYSGTNCDENVYDQ